MLLLLKRLLKLHIVRYALVGGIGIPVQDGALFVFLHLFGNDNRLFPLAYICAFEVSTTVNFILNQFFTYNDRKPARGWQWVARIFKAQMTSISAFFLAFGVSLALTYIFKVDAYIATPIGTICSFSYNFLISKRFVFRANVDQPSETIISSSPSPTSK